MPRSLRLGFEPLLDYRVAMDSQTTIFALCAGIGLAVIASIGDMARRRAPLAWYAYVPWHATIFLGIAVALFAAVHLSTLARSGGF